MSVDTVMSRNLEVARVLAAAGCAVFPCDPVTGEPLVEWRERSTTDIAALEALWQRDPYAVPAIDLDKAGLLVVAPHYGDDDDDQACNGFRAFEQLAKAHGWDIVTSAVLTPEGLHYYFRQPEGEPLESLASLNGHNIRIHGQGGCVIGPNVVRGSDWDWLGSSDTVVLDALAQHTVPVVPDWLAGLIRRGRDIASGPADGARGLPADPSDRPAVPGAPLRPTAFADAELRGDAAREPAPWEKPDLSYLGRGRTAPPGFPLDALGEFWGPWCAAHAKARSAPVDYVAGTLLAVTAALIGNRRWPQASSEWREPPVLWVALVGAPSAGKSPAQDPVLDLVHAIERDAQTRLLISATTPEALAVLLRDHPAGLLLHRDGLGGWLGKFSRHAGDGREREMWLASYGGRRFCIDRLKHPGPTDIPRLTIGILGSIAPDKLALVTKATPDGLLARFLWCWPEPAPGGTLQSVPVDNAMQLEALRRICALEMATEDDGGRAPGRLELGGEAAAAFEAFARTMKERALQSFGPMSEVLGKAPGHCLRLATTLRLLDWSHSPGVDEVQTLEREHVERAAQLVESYFLPMASRAFGEAAIPAHDLSAMTLAHWLRDRRMTSFNAREVRRRMAGRLRQPADMERACAALTEAGLIRPRPSRMGGSKGRTRSDFEVNPAIRRFPFSLGQ